MMRQVKPSCQITRCCDCCINIIITAQHGLSVVVSAYLSAISFLKHTVCVCVCVSACVCVRACVCVGGCGEGGGGRHTACAQSSTHWAHQADALRICCWCCLDQARTCLTSTRSLFLVTICCQSISPTSKQTDRCSVLGMHWQPSGPSPDPRHHT